MQETMKRVAAGALGLLMAGSTLLAPGLAAADLSSFASMKPSDTVIVVGANAITQDVVGAINIGGALAQHGATATVTSTTTVAGAVTGGVSLATTTTPLYMYDPITNARTTIAKGDLSVLDSGSVQDDSGVDYKYDQYLELGTGVITYSRPSELADPVLNVNMSTSSSTPLYTAKVVFNNPINVSDTTKAFGGNTIKLFGKDYTIGSTSTNTKLILFGAGDAATLQEGDETTVTVEGKSYTVKLLGVSDANIIVLKVGTDSRTLTKGNSYNIQGLDVYVNDVFYFSKQGAVSSSKLSFGSSRITLENAAAVKTGTSDTQVDGTLVTITGTGEIATLSVAVAAKETSKAYIKDGASFTDPVYGSFKVAFSGVNPSLSDTTRDTITFGTAGNDRVTVAVTDYNGKAKTLEFARDTAAATAGTALSFQDGNTYAYNVVEGAEVQQYHYILADAGDFSHLFQVSSFSSIGATGAKVTLKDVFSDTNYEITLTGGGNTNGSKVIDGQTYYANVTGGSTPKVKLTWGAGAAPADAGTQTTVFPGIKLKRGEYMYLTAKEQAVTLANNTAKTIRLPAGAALGTAGDISVTYLDSPDQLNITVGSTTTSGTSQQVLVGRQYYNISIGTIDAATEDISISLSSGTAGTSITQPAVMVMEEKDDNTQYNTVVVSATDNTNGAAVSMTVGISGTNSGGQGSTSDASVTRFVDLFGTLVTTDSDGQGKATLSYPDSQVIAGVYALETAASVPAVGTVSTGTAAVTQPSLAGGIAKVDSAVTSSDKAEKNLILVGGPAANALVAELAAANKTYDLNYWVANLQGKYVIQAVENAFATGKTAIVVAGYEYAQTQAASLKIATEALTGEKVQAA